MAPYLRREQRLLNATDYRRVFGAPDFRAGQRELLLLAKTNELPFHRLGLAVAKKHIPTAVKRNLVKRLAREHFRHLTAPDPAMDIVVLSRPGAASADRNHLNKAFASQFAVLQKKSRAQ